MDLPLPSTSRYLHSLATPGGLKSDKCVGQCSAESVITGLADLLTKTSIIINLVSFVKISHLDCSSGWRGVVGGRRGKQMLDILYFVALEESGMILQMVRQ